MMQIADKLTEIVQSAAERLRSISPAEAGHKPSETKWSKMEVVGHLIDSASNNHQRFVRAQQVSELVSPVYDQEQWVQIQDYNSSSWHDLIEFWCLYNQHLAHVIRRIPNEKLHVKCTIGNKDPVTLGDVLDQYIAHIKHHLDKIGAL